MKRSAYIKHIPKPLHEPTLWDYYRDNYNRLHVIVNILPEGAYHLNGVDEKLYASCLKENFHKEYIYSGHKQPASHK